MKFDHTFLTLISSATILLSPGPGFAFEPKQRVSEIAEESMNVCLSKGRMRMGGITKFAVKPDAMILVDYLHLGPAECELQFNLNIYGFAEDVHAVCSVEGYESGAIELIQSALFEPKRKDGAAVAGCGAYYFFEIRPPEDLE